MSKKSRNGQYDNKKPSHRKYMFLMYVIITLIIVSFVLYLPSYYLTDSEKIIREAAAESLNKDPNKFGWLDYSKVTKLDLSGKELFDLRYISKFKNLKHLSLDNIIVPPQKIPKWKNILQKFHIIKPKPQQNYNLLVTGKNPKYEGSFIIRWISQEELIDLSPIKKLKKLESISLSNTNSGKISGVLPVSKSPTYDSEDIFINTTVPFKNIKPLSSLTTLKTLNLNNIQISDLGPIKNLTNLKILYFINITEQQKQDLLKVLPELKINGVTLGAGR